MAHVLSKLKKIFGRGLGKRESQNERLARLANETNLSLGDLKNKIDFALAYAALHEAKDPYNFLKETFSALKKGGKFILPFPNFKVLNN